MDRWTMCPHWAWFDEMGLCLDSLAVQLLLPVVQEEFLSEKNHAEGTTVKEQ